MVGFVLISALIQAIFFLPQQAPGNPDATELILFIGLVIALLLVSVTFAAVGALIVTRTSGNLVGWLLLIVAVNSSIPTESILEIYFPSAPATVSPGLWLLLWLNSWSWLLGILPIFLIMLNFPTGQPPSRRWRWLNGLALGLVFYMALLGAFLNVMGPENGFWQVENPLGFIPENNFYLLFPFYVTLLIVAVGSVSALFMRRRRSVGVESQQIKWLLFSGSLCLFALGILLWIYAAGIENTPLSFGPLLLVFLSFLTLPISIAVAILRYRLYDLDIIIRRTLSYSILTATLGLVYFTGIVLLQNLFGGLFGGSDSPLITVISTLGIAALFNPLRNRIQEFIDRRFFRSKYDAEQALADFSVAARYEVNVEKLTEEVLGVVVDTMQPEHLSLWLKRQDKRDWEKA